MSQKHSDDSKRISDLFAASLQEVTPPPAGVAAHVLYVPISSNPEVTRRCSRVLSNPELERASRFALIADKALFIQRRAFRRYCGALALSTSTSLSEITFSETENGRPFLPDLPQYWFSFSSCHSGFVGAWSSTHSVGVDIEDNTKKLQTINLAEQFFSEAEARSVKVNRSQDSRQTFFKLWCLKEAALKSVGEGLPYGLDVFEFELQPRLRVVRAPLEHGGSGQFDAHLIESADSHIALIMRSRS